MAVLHCEKYKRRRKRPLNEQVAAGRATNPYSTGMSRRRLSRLVKANVGRSNAATARRECLTWTPFISDLLAWLMVYLGTVLSLETSTLRTSVTRRCALFSVTLAHIRRFIAHT